MPKTCSKSKTQLSSISIFSSPNDKPKSPPIASFLRHGLAGIELLLSSFGSRYLPDFHFETKKVSSLVFREMAEDGCRALR